MYKCVLIVFIYIIGIGYIFVKVICEVVFIDEICCVNELFDVEVLVICEYIDVNYIVEGDLCCEV